jgi:hypothetical protein
MYTVRKSGFVQYFYMHSQIQHVKANTLHTTIPAIGLFIDEIRGEPRDVRSLSVGTSKLICLSHVCNFPFTERDPGNQTPSTLRRTLNV